MEYVGLKEILTQFYNSFINFLPRLGGAIVLLIIGWVVGSLVGRGVKKILIRYKIDQRIGRGRKPFFRLSEIFPLLISWIIYLVFIQAALSEEVLGIPTLAEMVGAIISFLPGLLEGVIIVIVGYALAEYIREQIERSKLVYSEIVGNVLFFFIIYVSIALALPLWGINPSLVNNILLIIIGSIGAGLAIAIGLGLKDIVREEAKKYLKRIKKRRKV